MSYSNLSKNLTDTLTKAEKKNQGIFFTPPETVQKCLQSLQKYMSSVKNILEPSCGSGEFITALRDSYPAKNIVGVEFNEKIYDSIQELGSEKVEIIRADYLKYKPTSKFDLIIGNPPYFVLKKNEVEQKYLDFFEGRPNIYILFILQSLRHLNKNGVLCFILPSNFLNCLYYDKTRKYIYDNFEILHIEECQDTYLETQQETVIFMIRHKKNLRNNLKFTLSIDKYTIFAEVEKVTKLKSLLANAVNLKSLNFKVGVGNVVWNQKKSLMRDEPSYTRLIYSTDIKNRKLVLSKFKNEDKKNYIDMPGGKEIQLIINRGYGNSKYKFEYCLLDLDYEYLIENHLIYIKFMGELNREELLAKYQKIIESLKNKKTQQFISLYFGNNAINTTELGEILPIYDV